MITTDKITGIVLAGGKGRRMSSDGTGVNKALTPFNGQPMVAHVIERLRPQVGKLVLNINQDESLFASFGLPLISDAVTGYAGPLAGLHAGMSHADTDWIITAPCDSPFIPTDLVAQLSLAAQEQQAQLAVVSTGGRSQPVFTLVQRALTDNLAAFLAGGGRKIDAWYAPLSVAIVPFDDADAFRNINTQEDLARFEPRNS